MRIQITRLVASLAVVFAFSEVHAQGIITTVAGNGITQYIGDGWPATSYSLAAPYGICIDKDRNIFEVDYAVSRVRMLDTDDSLFTYAGTGLPGYTGDGGPATDATFRNPSGVAVDTMGNVYVVEEYNKVVRKINRATGIVSTVCGSGLGGYGGDGGPATAAKIEQPAGVCVDRAGNIYVADYGNHRIRKVDAGTGIISTVAGTGVNGYSGDGSSAIGLKLSYPKAVYVDAAFNIYIADYGNNRIRKVDGVTGIISTLAGTGTAGFTGDGGPATNAQFVEPSAVFMSKRGNLYIADYGNNVVRVITPDGTIHTVAGNGFMGYSGDGGSALAATMQGPVGVCVDDSEYLYIADWGNSAIRKVTPVYTAINEVSRTNSISVFPNPAKDKLYVSRIVANNEPHTIKIFNTTGMLVYETNGSLNAAIDINAFANGAYFLFYSERENYYTAKFIVQH